MSHAPARTTGSDPDSRSADRKTVLVCPRCTHESPARGDWELVVRDDTMDVHCPDCWTRLTSRSRVAPRG